MHLAQLSPGRTKAIKCPRLNQSISPVPHHRTKVTIPQSLLQKQGSIRYDASPLNRQFVELLEENFRLKQMPTYATVSPETFERHSELPKLPLLSPRNCSPIKSPDQPQLPKLRTRVHELESLLTIEKQKSVIATQRNLTRKNGILSTEVRKLNAHLSNMRDFISNFRVKEGKRTGRVECSLDCLTKERDKVVKDRIMKEMDTLESTVEKMQA